MAPESGNVPENPGEMEEDLAVHCAGRMTLESIVDSTGEFDHLNELVMLRIAKCGGYGGVEHYLESVTPVLDLLEVEIRVRYTPGMTRARMKQVIHDWIDTEIAGLR